MKKDLELLDAYISVATSTESIVKMVVERTDKKGNVITTEVNSRFAHGADGLVTEVGELQKALLTDDGSGYLDFVNIIEECGDVIWYLAITVDSLDLKFKDLEPDMEQLIGLNFERALDYMLIYASEILDKNKRTVFYGKPLETADIEKMLVNFLYAFSYFCSHAAWAAELDKERAIEIAIDKVTRKLTGDKGRYKDGFTQDEAYDRNLDNEREILEK